VCPRVKRRRSPELRVVVTGGKGWAAHGGNKPGATATPGDPEGAHPNGRNPSLIFDFSGFIAEADLSLTGTGTDLNTGAKAAYTFDTDMRFMKGTFHGTDGKDREGAFAFI